MEVLAKLKEIVDEYKGESIDLKNETTFDEIGFDSLDKVDLMMQVEEKFGIELDSDVMINTVGELAAKIEELTK